MRLSCTSSRAGFKSLPLRLFRRLRFDVTLKSKEVGERGEGRWSNTTLGRWEGEMRWEGEREGGGRDEDGWGREEVGGKKHEQVKTRPGQNQDRHQTHPSKCTATEQRRTWLPRHR